MGSKFVGVSCALVLAVAATGCSASRAWKEMSGGSVDTRKVERERSLAEFEQRRTSVQLAAAKERVARGATDDAKRMLNEVLQRQPACREASLLLADLHAGEADLESAEEVLVAALRQDTDDAELHHALGSVLELAERLPEAKAHFNHACRLRPTNAMYQESLANLSQVREADPAVASSMPEVQPVSFLFWGGKK